MKRREKHTFYNYQFKHTAVAVTNHPNIQSVDVAEALGIHPIMLYRWRQEMREGRIRDNQKEARSRSELLEAKTRIRALEREVKRLREENVILKKAERIFPEKSPRLWLHSRARGPLRGGGALPQARGLPKRLLRLASS